jgi:hypothetical protein
VNELVKIVAMWAGHNRWCNSSLRLRNYKGALKGVVCMFSMFIAFVLSSPSGNLDDPGIIINHPNSTSRNSHHWLWRRPVQTPRLSTAAAPTSSANALSQSTDPKPSAVIAATAATTRDPAQWPFTAASPWNTALGSGAIYSPISSPGFSSSGGASLNMKNWSHPIYVATMNDPMVTITANNYGYLAAPNVFKIHCPVGAMPDPQSDGAFHVIDPTHSTVVECWAAHRSGEIVNATVAVQWILKTEQGIWQPGHRYATWLGARAYGGSAIAGIIRRSELVKGVIPHALGIAVHGNALNKNAPGGTTFVWPASSSDGGGSYGSSGNLYMGSLLAIPPSVDLSTLGLSAQGMMIGKAMQDYGAIISDQGGGNVIYYVEPAASDVLSTGAQELGKLTPYLRVVTNNTPATVGGGGSRRQPSAPPFQ